VNDATRAICHQRAQGKLMLGKGNTFIRLDSKSKSHMKNAPSLSIKHVYHLASSTHTQKIPQNESEQNDSAYIPSEANGTWSRR
jgi:hypothetical protein